jgi:hypothetical protein
VGPTLFGEAARIDTHDTQVMAYLNSLAQTHFVRKNGSSPVVPTVHEPVEPFLHNESATVNWLPLAAGRLGGGGGNSASEVLYQLILAELVIVLECGVIERCPLADGPTAGVGVRGRSVPFVKLSYFLVVLRVWLTEHLEEVRRSTSWDLRCRS